MKTKEVLELLERLNEDFAAKFPDTYVKRNQSTMMKPTATLIPKRKKKQK